MGLSMRKELIEGMKKLNGECVSIKITHRLYGNQKIRCVFNMFENDNALGFNVNGQNIYIEKDKINEFCVVNIDKSIWFKDDVMRIDILKKH